MSVQEKVERFFALLLNPSRPQSSKLGFPLLQTDPVLNTARQLGYKVVEYDLPPYPLFQAAVVGIRMLTLIVSSSVVAYLLFHHVSGRSPAAKWFSIISLITALLAWPMVTGMSGVMLLDFWRPALGFRSAMLVWDIFVIRSRSEVEAWSFIRFFAQLWTFPKEIDELEERARLEGYQRNARIENLKGMPKVALEALALFSTLYFIPPYELTKGMSQLAYHCYCYTLGLSILMALALFGDGLLKLLGAVINIEMADMFENPLATTNIRLFWSHWNRAIATVLHRVVFGGGKSKMRLRMEKQPTKVSSLSNAERSHLDHLSETDTGHTSGEEEKGYYSRKTHGLKPLSKVNGDVETKKGEKASNSVNDQQSASSLRGVQSSRKSSSFLPKAAAAIATFAMSGVFHEHITYFTFGHANGENFLFFLANGVATVAATWFKRTFPEINKRIPTLASVLMLHLFFLAIVPLFCSPFIRSGFFVQLESLKYELLPIRERPRGSFIYVFGQ